MCMICNNEFTSNTTQLDCSNCSVITALDNLVGSSNLQSINFLNCPNLTSLPNLNNCTSLKKISCMLCPNLISTPDLSNCTLLGSVKLCDLQSFTTIQGISLLPNIFSIELWSCPNLQPFEIPQSLIDINTR